MGFESVGVVERITGPLASAASARSPSSTHGGPGPHWEAEPARRHPCAVPVLYMSTVSTDYVLIPVDRCAAPPARRPRQPSPTLANLRQPSQSSPPSPPSPPSRRPRAALTPSLPLSGVSLCRVASQRGRGTHGARAVRGRRGGACCAALPTDREASQPPAARTLRSTHRPLLRR